MACPLLSFACLIRLSIVGGDGGGGWIALSLLLAYLSRYHQYSNGPAMTLYLLSIALSPPLLGSSLLAALI